MKVYRERRKGRGQGEDALWRERGRVLVHRVLSCFKLPLLHFLNDLL